MSFLTTDKGQAKDKKKSSGGFLSGISSAEVNSGRRYITPGKYSLEVKVVNHGSTRNREPFFAVELEVVETDSADYKTGDTVNWFQKLTNDAALGNIKGFLCAAYKVEPEELTEEQADKALDEDQPLVGEIVWAEAFEVTTKAGNPFTVVNWITPED